jgi:hypothetical protein
MFYFLFTFLFYLKFFFVRNSSRLPTWATVLIVAAVSAVVVGGAVGAGVALSQHGQYFYFTKLTDCFS